MPPSDPSTGSPSTSAPALDYAAPPAEAPWPSAGRAWYALGVLMIVLVLAILDQQIITFLVEPIKSDLGLSDLYVSLLMGFAFVAFYVLVGLPIARLSDVHSRRLIIGIGITFWSLATAACGLARTGWQLAAARVAVGMGEACNGPATFSILSDYFPPARRARALSILSMGFFFGAAIASIVGSRVYAFALTLPVVDLPGLGVVKPWQLTFILVGLPGVLVAGLMATVREPIRRGLLPQGGSAPKRAAIPVRDVLRFLVQERRIYAPLFGGLSLRFLINFGTGFWVPSFLVRTYGWSIADAGLAIGTVQLTAAPLGLLAGALLAEWAEKRGYTDANLRVNLISTILMLPTAILFPLMPSAAMAVGLFAANAFLSSLGPGPVNAALQTITPNQMRAQVTAMYLLLFNLVGRGIGPLLVAFMTDHIFAAELNLRYSIALDAALLGPPACLLFALGLKPYRQGVARAKSWA